MNEKIDYVTFIRKIFGNPIINWYQYIIILCVAFAFIFIPQQEPNDWKLNTDYYWSSFPNSYMDQSKVYPPWGLILMIPYYLMHSEGSRFFSVLVIGWLVVKRRWTLLQFFSIIFSYFFLVTMIKSNIDIFVFIFPILLWEITDRTRWQSLGWGIAMSLSLLKPQGMFFVWVYWLWSNRRRLDEMIIPFCILALVIVPISLVGSPPLFFQWIHNLQNPSNQNKIWWKVNNLSLTSSLGLFWGLAVILLAILIVFTLVRMGRIKWSKDHLYASLLFLSFFLSPYSSQQSVSSAFAFVPSWQLLVIQYAGILLGRRYFHYYDNIPIYVLFFAFSAMYYFKPNEEKL
jgi:hypothetical protein